MMTKTFHVGDEIRIRESFPEGHIRTPHYIRGKKGIITEFLGSYNNPEELAKGIRDSPKKKLYRIRFLQTIAWPDYKGSDCDTLDIDIYEHWIEMNN